MDHIFHHPIQGTEKYSAAMYYDGRWSAEKKILAETNTFFFETETDTLKIYWQKFRNRNVIIPSPGRWAAEKKCSSAASR